MYYPLLELLDWYLVGGNIEYLLKSRVPTHMPLRRSCRHQPI
jgi:hypothetical protein